MGRRTVGRPRTVRTKTARSTRNTDPISKSQYRNAFEMIRLVTANTRTKNTEFRLVKAIVDQVHA
jgi:hypothetical protein